MNVGKDTDDLKFIFNSPGVSTTLMFMKDQAKYPDDAVIRPYGEITYHSDGSVLYKFPQGGSTPSSEYSNPHGKGFRRIPLNQIDDWEPLIQAWILRYQDLRRDTFNDQVFVPRNTRIFNGDPFEYLLLLVNETHSLPDMQSPDELLFRVKGIAESIDLLLVFSKSNFRAVPFTIGEEVALNDNNRLRIIDRVR